LTSFIKKHASRDSDLGTANQSSDGPAPGSNGQCQIKVCKMSDVESQMVEWLWEGWFAIGKCHLLVGQPGIGKSFASTCFASIITTGGLWPDGTRCPVKGEVVFLCGEDDKADTIKPRLDAHDADCSKVFLIESRFIRPDGEDCDPVESQIRLDRDLDEIDKFLSSRPEVAALFIDPIAEYLGRVDSHRDTEVRQVLAPLSKMAEKHRIVIASIAHFNKSNMGPALYRAMGSLAFTAQARIAWGFIKDHEDPDRVLVLPLKNNIHRTVPGRAFRIVDGRVEWEDDGVNITADEAMEPPKTKAGGKVEEAVSWLRDRLADGCVESEKLEADSVEHGISKRSYWRARKELGVVCTKSRMTSDGKWFVSLPEQETSENGSF
jgi:hypothetical protein